MLAIDSATPTTLYAGTFSGGAFKSTDRGDNWIAINNGLPLDPGFGTSVTSLAIDPATPTTLYAVTFDEVGLFSLAFKSTDGGDSWSAIMNGLTAQFIYELTIDSATPTTVYAGKAKVAQMPARTQ